LYLYSKLLNEYCPIILLDILTSDVLWARDGAFNILDYSCSVVVLHLSVLEAVGSILKAKVESEIPNLRG